MTISKIWHSITKPEWFFVGLVSLAAIIVTTAPAIYGALVTPPNKIFTAMHFVSADDWFVYYSFINQAKGGSWLFKDLYSSLDHVAVFRPEWLVVGWLAKIFNLSAPLAFHLARILLIPAFFSAAYIYLAYLFADRWRRQLALGFLSFSSGLGILFSYRLILYPQNFAHGFFQWPMDLWVPDINTFLTLFVSPHFIAATILVIAIFFFTSLFVESNSYWYAVWSGLCGLALFSFHPFQVLKMLIIMFVFFVVWSLVKKNFFWSHALYYLIFTAISTPAVVYYLWLLKYDQLTMLRAIQNINPTTPLYLTLVAFGGLLVLAVVGVYFLDKRGQLTQPKYLLISVWAGAQLILLYAPVNYQRRLALGIHFPLVVLTVIALVSIYAVHQQKINRHQVTVFVLLFLVFVPSTLFALATEIMVFSQARQLSYIDVAVAQGFDWLKHYSPRGAVVFSSSSVGNILPAYAVRTSYVGHAVETPYFVERRIEPAWFFDHNRSPEVEQRFLTERNISYLFFGPDEQALGSFDPASKPYLQQVFDSSGVKIYQVL